MKGQGRTGPEQQAGASRGGPRLRHRSGRWHRGCIRGRNRSRKLGVAAALLAVAAATLLGCSYSKILRNRLPAPQYVERDGVRLVLFQYEAPQARHVNLCGNWDENSWCGTRGTGRFDHTIGVMTDENGDGVWEVAIPMDAGRYQYKYALDYGVRWEPDPNNPLTEDDGFGGNNSVLILR